MHIPDNYLSPSTCGIFVTAMLPIWYYAIRKVKKTISADRIPLIGVGAAFVFLLMMFNLPIPGGTTAHAVGGTLIAVLLGPYAACIAVSVALFIQAVVFGDGGILAFGANAFNMAFVLVFTGYYSFYGIKKLWPTAIGEKASILIGAYVGINAAAFCAALEFGLQPLFFTDTVGKALYCPYPLAVSLPTMMITHLFFIGIAEAVFSLFIYEFIFKVSPEILHADREVRLNPIIALIILLVVVSPLGLIAGGTAWGEWRPDEIVQNSMAALDYIPAKMLTGFNYHALLPDYTVGALPAAAGYILSAAIGAAVLVILFKLIGSMRSGSNK